MTTDTPIQFPDDDRTLVRQMFAMVQSIDARLTALEARDAARSVDTVGKLDKLLLEVAEARQELRDVKTDVHRIDRKLSRVNLDVAEIATRVDALEDRETEQ